MLCDDGVGRNGCRKIGVKEKGCGKKKITGRRWSGKKEMLEEDGFVARRGCGKNRV